jgi:hypothetical protein
VGAVVICELWRIAMSENLKEKYQLGDLGINSNISFKEIEFLDVE